MRSLTNKKTNKQTDGQADRQKDRQTEAVTKDSYELSHLLSHCPNPVKDIQKLIPPILNKQKQILELAIVFH